MVLDGFFLGWMDMNGLDLSLEFSHRLLHFMIIIYVHLYFTTV
jgi:hypothetical protein